MTRIHATRGLGLEHDENRASNGAVAEREAATAGKTRVSEALQHDTARIILQERFDLFFEGFLGRDAHVPLAQLAVLRNQERGGNAPDGTVGVLHVLATETDPRLPPGAVDLVLMVDVYHELSRPDLVAAAVARSLRPREEGRAAGRLVLVEYRGAPVSSSSGLITPLST